MVAVEWSEGFALPIAPAVMFLQFGCFFPRWWMRLGGSASSFAAVLLMYQQVAGIELAPAEGANIGAGILAFEVVISFFILSGAVIREAVEACISVHRRWRERRGVSGG